MNTEQVLLLAPLTFAVAWAVGAFHRLVALRQQVVIAFESMENHLNRRHALVAPMLELARRHLAGERELLESVAIARNLGHHATLDASEAPGDRDTVAALMRAERKLSEALGRLSEAAATRPAFGNDPEFVRLDAALVASHECVRFSRDAYNRAAAEYNTAIRKLPGRLFALVLGMAPSQPCEPLPRRRVSSA